MAAASVMQPLLQRAIALLSLVALAPFIAALAAAVKLDTRGPALYRAQRIGRGGIHFACLKLRTMRVGDAGGAISVANDERVTRLGAVLRRYRLDELPQLWNVVRGDMLLVGPRPEDPRFVRLDDPLHRRVFTATPGITGATQLVFAGEATLLDPADPEGSYRERLLPAKLALDARYLAHRSGRLDAWILWSTIRTVLGRGPTRAQVEAML